MVSHNLHVRKRVQHVVVSLLTLSQYNVRRFAIASVNTCVAIAREQSHTMQQSLRIHQTSKHFQNYNNIVMMSYVIFGQQVKQHGVVPFFSICFTVTFTVHGYRWTKLRNMSID
jgi:hypothetical protein